MDTYVDVDYNHEDELPDADEFERLENDPRPFWQRLPPRLLNTKGKKVVDSDPDLGYQTMKTLVEVHPPKTHIYTFQFDSDADIGVTVLALCVKDNIHACMAELVARYAATCKVPFTDAALAILKLYRSRGIIYYEHIRGLKHPIVKKWHPYYATFVPPPPKRKK